MPTSPSCRKCRACTRPTRAGTTTWPEAGQHEFLTHEGSHSVYGMNAVYQDGHHGNAVVSRHPIPVWENIDVSHHAAREPRAPALRGRSVDGWKEPLHCINVHLGLWARSRRFQLKWLSERIESAVPARRAARRGGRLQRLAPRGERYPAAASLGSARGLRGRRRAGPRAASRRSMPMLALDRIYVRGLNVDGGASATWARRGRGSRTTWRSRRGWRWPSGGWRGSRRRRGSACPRRSSSALRAAARAATRPSMMCALFTPFRTASSAHSILGSMPPEIVPSSIISFTLARVRPVMQLALLVEHARGVGEQDQLLGLQRDRRACPRRRRR